MPTPKKKRPGVFDPWRQADAAPPPPPSAATPAQTSESVERHCVQYRGVRTGLNVWVVESDEDASTRARQTLVNLIYDLHQDETARDLLNARGVSPGRVESPATFTLNDGVRYITVAIDSRYPNKSAALAVDALVVAFRDVQRSKSPMADEIQRRGVRPYWC